MRNVIFVAPYLKEQSMRFVDAVRGLDDVRVIGFCMKDQEITPHNRNRFDELVQVDDCFKVESLEAAAKEVIRRHGPLHRIVSILEIIQLTVARVRERLGLPGLTVSAAERFLDKSVMKTTMRELGLPCARHTLLRNEDDAAAFAREVGFPIVVKPPVGAACVSTFFVNNDTELREALAQATPSADKPAQAEEFIKGEEFTFETVTVGGKVRFHGINRYIPTPLEVVRNPWMQWIYIGPRDISGPEFDDVRRIGADAVERMGMRDGITHMEWFRRTDGSMAIGEIAARPPGAQLVEAMSIAHEVNFFRVWARAIIDGEFDGPFERKWAVGACFLRGAGTGKVSRVDGIDEVKRRFGHLIAHEFIPVVGTEKQPTYEGDGHIIVKSKDTEEVERALREIVGIVKVHYA